MAEDPAANAAQIERFYAALARRDHAEMGRCYVGDVRFSDPAFGELHGPEVRAMWRMLCERAQDFELAFSDVQAEGDRGSASWQADYTFTATGRRVHNEIEAAFRFRDGLIAEHDDRFGLWRWSRQALGPVGLVLGWSPIVRSRVQGQARENLRRYMAGEADGDE